MDLAQYTVGLGHINQPKIRAIQVPVPPVEVQKRVVEKCEYYDSIIDRLKEEIQDLEESDVITQVLSSITVRGKKGRGNCQ